jgi:hypothetical protein
MFNRLFSEDVYIQQINSADVVLAAGAYPASGSYIDVSNFKRCGFLVELGTTAHAQTWQVQQATANNGTLKDLTGALISSGVSDDGKWWAVEFDASKLDINNAYKFVTLLNAGGTTGDYAQITFFGFMAGHNPVTQGATKAGVVVVAD